MCGEINGKVVRRHGHRIANHQGKVSYRKSKKRSDCGMQTSYHEEIRASYVGHERNGLGVIIDTRCKKMKKEKDIRRTLLQMMNGVDELLEMSSKDKDVERKTSASKNHKERERERTHNYHQYNKSNSNRNRNIFSNGNNTIDIIKLSRCDGQTLIQLDIIGPVGLSFLKVLTSVESWIDCDVLEESLNKVRT